jgi:hypothetical protein
MLENDQEVDARRTRLLLFEEAAERSMDTDVCYPGAEYANPSTGRNFAGLSTIVLRNGYPNIACAAQRTSAQKANVTPDIENRRCA